MELVVRPHLFLGGEWVSPEKDEAVDVVEASTGLVMGRCAQASTADVDRAVDAARHALTGPWSRLTSAERAERIAAFAAALKARGRATAALVSRENGMPITLSNVVNGIGPAAIATYYAHLAAADVPVDERPSPTGGRTLVERRPVGVVAAITPWNYPQPLALMKVAPALAAGCTIVLKPPPETSLDAFAIAEAAEEAQLPPGVLNVIPGGREAGARLVEHPGVDKVAFTGSTAAGRSIGAVAGRLLRPATLELGGKSVSLLLEDADLSLVGRTLLDVSLPNNGQTCHAATRILAPASRYAEVVDLITDVVGSLRAGDPLDPETQVGPLVSQAQQQRVLGYIEQGRTGGARVTTGGAALDREGWYVEPTVFADVDNASVIAQEEIFGPVLCIIPYRDLDDALAIANDSEYGLGGVVWSADEERGVQVARRIHTGTVGVNRYELHLNAPFGGVKSSGLGRELGPEGLLPYLTKQSIYLA